MRNTSKIRRVTRPDDPMICSTSSSAHFAAQICGCNHLVRHFAFATCAEKHHLLDRAILISHLLRCGLDISHALQLRTVEYAGMHGLTGPTPAQSLACWRGSPGHAGAWLLRASHPAALPPLLPPVRVSSPGSCSKPCCMMIEHNKQQPTGQQPHLFHMAREST